MEQAVIVEFQYAHRDLDPLYELEDTLREVINTAQVGELDGHQIALDSTEVTLFMYGPDADELLRAVLPMLKDASFLTGASVTRRYGEASDPNAREVVTPI